MTRATTMLVNSFRIACRQLRSPGVGNGSYATLGSLAHLPQASQTFPHTSLVDHLLKTPPLFPSPPWTPTAATAVSPPPYAPYYFAAPVPTVKIEQAPESRIVDQAADEDRSNLILSASDIHEEVAPDAVIFEPVDEPAVPEQFHAFIDDIVAVVKKEIRAENTKKKRVLRKTIKPKEETTPTVPPVVGEENKEAEEGDGFMICCGRRAKPIDISPRKRKLPLKTESASAPKKKKVMDAEEMATRIRSQNRAAAKKYRQSVKIKRRKMDAETDVLQEEQARLLQHVQELTVEVEEYKGKLLMMALQCPFPQGDNG